MYQRMIQDDLEAMGRGDIDPRHVEAYMRLQYGTLDHLDRRTFRAEVRLGVGCVDEGGQELAETNARSYGL